ncbi:hypothetical protein ACN38_g2589, partial [Penicillium nordicum]
IQFRFSSDSVQIQFIFSSGSSPVPKRAVDVMPSERPHKSGGSQDRKAPPGRGKTLQHT